MWQNELLFFAAEMEKMEIKIGANAVLSDDSYQNRAWTRLIKEIYDVQAEVRSKGMNLLVTVYDSFPNALASGRTPDLSYNELLSLYENLSLEGVPFSLSLNARHRSGRQEQDLLRFRPLIQHLLNSMARYPRRNAVIISENRLLRNIRTYYGDAIKCTASCIKFSGLDDEELYVNDLEDALAVYDEVVIDNPHVSEQLLMDHVENIDKVMLFLNSRCAVDGIRCRHHYDALTVLNQRAEEGEDVKRLGLKVYNSFMEAEPDICLNEKAKLAHPDNREMLQKFLAMGVRKFKVARRDENGNGEILRDYAKVILEAAKHQFQQ